MNGFDFLADTNVIISIKEGRANAEPFITYKLAISFVTEIELLGRKNISKIDKKIYSEMINQSHSFQMDNEIKNECIRLKQIYGIKTPDAIIAATAILNQIPLITGDKDFAKIKDLDLILI